MSPGTGAGMSATTLHCCPGGHRFSLHLYRPCYINLDRATSVSMQLEGRVITLSAMPRLRDTRTARRCGAPPPRLSGGCFGPIILMPFEVAHGLVRSAGTLSRAVRLHDFVPHHLSGLFHRARELPRLYRGAVAAHRQCRAPRRVRLLEENLRGGIRHGCGVGPGDELSVRYQ